MEDSSIIIQDDGQKTTVMINWGTQTKPDLPTKVPKKEKIEKRDRCPRCLGKTLIDVELGGQKCTVCGWPDKEDARKRARERKNALIKKI